MAELISELVWQPMGAKEDADFTLDHFRTAIYNGGMCATLQGSLQQRDSKHISALYLVTANIHTASQTAPTLPTHCMHALALSRLKAEALPDCPRG